MMSSLVLLFFVIIDYYDVIHGDIMRKDNFYSHCVRESPFLKERKRFLSGGWNTGVFKVSSFHQLQS